ncbi:hypothetical protein FD755_019051, partial [Muntiacus reevesi]
QKSESRQSSSRGETPIPSRKNSLIAAPSAVSTKIKVPAPQPIVKKDKRQNSSRFSASNNRELQKLPSLKGRDLWIHGCTSVPSLARNPGSPLTAFCRACIGL